MPDHHALLLHEKGGDLKTGPAMAVDPGARQIAVRVRAVAINPVDRYMPPLGRFITPWLQYPAVLGSDVAGEVVAVGADVSRFRVGQRVVGFALGTDKGRGPAEGAFQDRVLLDDHMASPIPDVMPFEEAAVLPLGLATAASGLFQTDFLALRHPTAGPHPPGDTILIWGGSTSVGSNAIQLAKLAGYDVFTTASPRNHSYVMGLGARAAFDYRSPSVVAELIAAIGSRRMAGAMAIGEGSLAACISVLKRTRGRRFVAVATPAVSFESLINGGTSWPRLIPFMIRMGVAGVRDTIAARLAGVATKFIWGSSLKDNEVGPMIFENFLPHALANGRYQAAPAALVSGHGLEAIPSAFTAQAGVSARKIVVSMGAVV